MANRNRNSYPFHNQPDESKPVTIIVRYMGRITTIMLLSNLLRVLSRMGSNYSKDELARLAAIKRGETIAIGNESFTAEK